MARQPLVPGQVPPRPHPTPMEKHIATKRARPKDPKAAEAFYADEARRAGLDPQEVDAAAGTNTETTVANAKSKKSIINTATRGDEEKQSIATPWAFIHALEHRFGLPVDFDLAAEEGNAKAPTYFTKEHDALRPDCDWSDLRIDDGVGGTMQAKLAYLNSPFGNIGPWSRKVANCRWLKRWTVALWPASYSTDWFLELRGKVVLDAIPRIQFEGAAHLYPKDLTLVVAGFGLVGAGYWDWRASYLQRCWTKRIEPDPLHLKGVTRFPVDPVLPDFNWTPDPFWRPQVPT